LRESHEEVVGAGARGHGLAAAEQGLDADELGLGEQGAVGEVAGVLVERGEGGGGVVGAEGGARAIEDGDFGGEAARVERRGRRLGPRPQRRG
jgi:hypothetical protein